MENIKTKITAKHVGLTVLSIIVAVIVTVAVLVSFGAQVGYVVVELIGKLLGDYAKTPVWEISNMYLMFIGIWIVTLAMFAIIKWLRPMFRAIGTKCSGNNLKNLLIGLALGFGTNFIVALAAMLNGDIVLVFDSFKPIGLILVFICVFIQSSAEELICRGYMYQKILKGSGSALLAIIVNSVFFALLHASNPGIGPLPYINLLLSGLIFSLMVYYMDSIWAAFGMHAAWNYTQNIILGLPNSGITTPFSMFKLDAASGMKSFAYDPAFGIEGTVMSVLVLGIVAAALIYWGIKNNRKPTDIWAESVQTAQ